MKTSLQHLPYRMQQPFPVIEYAEHAATNTAFAPVSKNVAPAPAVLVCSTSSSDRCSASGPAVTDTAPPPASEYVAPAPAVTSDEAEPQALTRSWLNATVSTAACYLGSWILKQCTPAIAPSSVHSQDLLPIWRWEGRTHRVWEGCGGGSGVQPRGNPPKNRATSQR